jgi:4-amino-4-deoxy-L-arabinose transferase-like glycosyltransferase
LSFYMQAPFQQLLEPGIHSARLGVALYSLLATLAFYWLVRQLAPVPLALLSTYLLSISIMDISASRLANVESHVKLWPILALAFLASAVQKRRWELYFLSGLALALGLLTYDTVWPIFIVVILLAVFDLFFQSEGWKTRIKNIAALLLPPLLTMPIIVLQIG